VAEIVNLRTVRKQRRRAADRASGTEAAARSGETRAEAERREAETERARRLHDGHRIEGPTRDEES
jgi:hypothetical protein